MLVRDGVFLVRFMFVVVELWFMSDGVGVYLDLGFLKRLFVFGLRKLELWLGLGEILEFGEKFGFVIGL